MSTSSVGVALPGFRSPAVGPDTPFEMLEACHERVRRTLQLLEKLQTYLINTGHDASAALAAQDVLRYFNLAAPLHHQDEELHVFPPLLALGDAVLSNVVNQLLADHRAMETAWPRAAAVLQQIAAGSCATWQALDLTQTADLQKFSALYEDHIFLEESQIYPRAREVCLPSALQAMSADMVHRRTHG